MKVQVPVQGHSDISGGGPMGRRSKDERSVVLRRQGRFVGDFQNPMFGEEICGVSR